MPEYTASFQHRPCPPPGHGGERYQQLGRAQDVQGERLHPGVVHAQLAVDARALDAGQDAQVGGEPRGVCEGNRGLGAGGKQRARGQDPPSQSPHVEFGAPACS